MKRGLVFSLCAAALVISSSSVRAQDNVRLSLNLRYNDPADPSEGGRWFLMAQTTPDANNVGIAGISAYLSNITAPAGIVFGNPTLAGGYPVVTNSATTLNANVATAGGTPFNGTFGGAINVVYGQDNSLTAPNPLLAGVGASGGGLVASDPLKNAAWNNSTLIMSGNFAGARPAFVTAGANSTDANTLQNTTLGVAALDANISPAASVRGDSLKGLGLNSPATAGINRGDTDRNFVVNGDDLNTVLANFNQAGKTWNQGDVTDGLGGHVEGAVNGDDLNQVLAFFNVSSATPPPAVSSVPEPATLGLCAMAAVGLLACVRRQR